MSLKPLLAGFAVLLCTATVSLAQSNPYCGPNAPTGNTYGTPHTGTLAGERGGELCRRLNFHRHAYFHHRRHWHRYSYR
jgi:hypothetical protein